MSNSVQGPYERAKAAAVQVRAALPPRLQQPKIAIVCGSGLNGLQNSVTDTADTPRVEIAYADIPDFPQPTVEGHEGKLVFGVMGSRAVPVMLLVGRVHFYEGHSMELVSFATRLCRSLEAQILILTNAAGGLRPSYSTGDIMLLSDHINLPGLAGSHPLLGPNDPTIGPRFAPLSDAYDLDLRRRAHRVWAKSRRDASAPQTQPSASLSSPQRQLHEGTYVMVSGPTYETRAEARYLSNFADAVGMSTVPEVVVARHSGVRVLAASLITNCVVLDPVPRGDDPAIRDLTRDQLDEHMTRGRAAHDEVVEEGARAAEDLIGLVTGVVEDLSEDGSV